MVELHDVSFSYTKESGTLTHVDLTIQPGECVLLCGASGCGKTTITKLVNGLIPAFTEACTLTGQVLLHGAPVREQPLYQLARQVGSVFQNPKSQFFHMDSDSELAFGLENQGITRGEILRRLDDTTDRLHLKRLRGRNIFAMSGGEKQLLAFASVYAMGPELYILDEPTANLDRDRVVVPKHPHIELYITIEDILDSVAHHIELQADAGYLVVVRGKRDFGGQSAGHRGL